MPNVEELANTSRLYSLHCGIELNEELPNAAAAAAATEMSLTDKRSHHLWLKSKASRYSRFQAVFVLRESG